MSSFYSELLNWPEERRQKILDSATTPKIKTIISASLNRQLSPQEFLVLLSPQAGEYVEEMAWSANRLTLNNFGRARNIFTPLYISDVCENQCRYCGFNAKNPQPRRHLSVNEAVAEAEYIADKGFKHILLLTGDAPRLATPQYMAEVVGSIRPLFSSIGVEVYSLTEKEYRLLVESGVDSMTMFQETYEPDLYAWLHPVGPKHDFLFRLSAPERAASAGMASLGIGALLGLTEFVHDAFFTGLHAYWLQKKFPSVEISVSIPRICPHEGEFNAPHALTDHQLVQYVTALRCFLPRSGITCSSRENAVMRNHLLPLGVTRVSAGVSTAVGGRAIKAAATPGQFEISDSRSLQEMMTDLYALGYQPVLKDWENANMDV